MALRLFTSSISPFAPMVLNALASPAMASSAPCAAPGAAAASGCKVLVLTAFGCGANGHPPDTVAELFRTAVRERGGSLQLVTFGILNDHNTGRGHNPEGNLGPFQKAFRRSRSPCGPSPSEGTGPPAAQENRGGSPEKRSIRGIRKRISTT